MIFAIHLLDRPDAGTLRAELRPQHLDYLRAIADRMAFAGPLQADDGQAAVGSLLVIDFADRAEAEQWLAAEPFTQAGVYAKTSILRFKNRYAQKLGFPVD